MQQTIQAGTILIEDRPLIADYLAIESKPYAANWSVVEGADGFALDRKIHAAGWNFFFFAGEVRAIFFGAADAKNIRGVLKRMLAKVSEQNFNCLEVTAIASKRFVGVPLHGRFRPSPAHPAGLGTGRGRAPPDRAEECRIRARLMHSTCNTYRFEV